MLLILLAYLGGVLTILSPCILPVLPFVFARADRSFVRSSLPLLAGMAVTFAGVATLAAVGGGWAAQANQVGRALALVLLAVFGVTLIWPRLAERLTHPLVSAGNRLAALAQADGKPAGAGASFLLGIATGLLWAPCAGPILGLVLTGAAIHGANVGTTLLLAAYAAGAATSLAVALLIGGRVFAAMKRSLGAGEWVRRGLGVAMLAGVAAIATGLDTGLLARVSTLTTGGVEQRLVDLLSSRHVAVGDADARPTAVMVANANATDAAIPVAATPAVSLPVEGTIPSLSGAVQWLNSPPLSAADLRGKVVLLDIWTYSCINCLRTLPYVKAWASKYKDDGLVVIGVHAPEFAFERDTDNVKRAVANLGITYPVAIDNKYAIWDDLNNEYWPAHYIVDAQGRIRYHHFGEGSYDETERVIQQLLAEAGHPQALQVALGLSQQGMPMRGVQAAADDHDLDSPETYIGYERAANFSSPGGAVHNAATDYTTPATLGLNDWGLAGDWHVAAQYARLQHPAGRIVFRFHARDLHLVLGPGAGRKPVHFVIRIDGAAPGDAHGSDVAPDGGGVVTDERLYQLVRQKGPVTDHTFEIEFLDPGVQAYSFTFG
ncbi:MAG TPA: cytochrome c biogenesis protein DipZ [Steroidobacteraceae bacterium]|jgi:cytochrome c biogenesis protein CcdA/thiol-disulfide isomerase/thioredoxin